MYPEHLKTFDYVGLHQYFLTFCTHERHRLFEKAGAVSLVRTQIERAATALQFAVIAYCFMPDHVHLLVEVRQMSPIAASSSRGRSSTPAFTTRQSSAIACGSDMDTSTSSAATKLL
jgi:REP element-mobilizing transposase RayT